MTHLMCQRHASGLAFLYRTLREVAILEGSVMEDFLSLSIIPPVSRAERHRNLQNQSRFPRECRDVYI